MKRSVYQFIILIIFIIFINIISPQILAATPNPTPSITPRITKETEDQERIEKIKDLVASKVAELKLVEKRGILGVVKSASNTQITLEDSKSQQRIIEIDELTKFSGSDRESFGISDVKEGDFLSAVGLYNKDSKKLLARFIWRVQNIPLNLEGVVLEKDKVDFTLIIVGADGKKKTVDVQTSTKTSVFEEGQILKSGFSKINEGERILIVGFPDLKDRDRINASRIIYFPSLPVTDTMKKYVDFAKNEAPVSSGSGKKLQPITR